MEFTVCNLGARRVLLERFRLRNFRLHSGIGPDGPRSSLAQHPRSGGTDIRTPRFESGKMSGLQIRVLTFLLAQCCFELVNALDEFTNFGGAVHSDDVHDVCFKPEPRLRAPTNSRFSPADQSLEAEEVWNGEDP